MVKIIRYRCEDGREFVEKKEAVEHEAVSKVEYLEADTDAEE